MTDTFVVDTSNGARVGIAFGGAPKDFNPMHLEGRISYWFGGVADAGLRGYVTAGGGTLPMFILRHTI